MTVLHNCHRNSSSLKGREQHGVLPTTNSVHIPHKEVVRYAWYVLCMLKHMIIMASEGEAVAFRKCFLSKFCVMCISCQDIAVVTITIELSQNNFHKNNNYKNKNKL